jgi:hypothetical protein
MHEGCPAAFERLARDGCILRGVSLPTPQDATAPLAGSGTHGRLVCLAFVAWLLIIDLGPAGMPGGCRRPRHARVAAARGTLEAPVPPGLLATACRDGCHARVFVACLGGGDAGPLCAAGDEEAGRQDGPGPWHGVKQRAVGMRLGTVRHGVVAVGNGRQRDPAWGHEGVDQEPMGGEAAVIGGQRPRTLDGLEAGGADIG